MTTTLKHSHGSSWFDDSGSSNDTSTPDDQAYYVAPSTGDGSADQSYVPYGDASMAGGQSSSGGSSGTGSGSSGTSSTQVITTAGSGLTFDITWDSSVSSAPTAFKTAVVAAVTYLETLYTNAITLNIDIGYGEVAGSAMGSGALGESESYLSSVSYSTLRSALATKDTSAAGVSAVASLPTSSPISNATYWTTTADAKALGLISATSTAVDGYVGFSSSLPFTYSDTSGVASGTYDFNGVALHELTEVMGRMLFTGGSIGSTSNSYNVLDLFHYSSAGVLDTSATTPGYFSANGGVTNLDQFNTVSGGDAGDLSSSMGNNAFDAYSNGGVVNPMTTNDATMMNVLGYQESGSTPAPTPTPTPTPAPTPALTPTPAPTPAPTGVGLYLDTAGLGASSAASGLAAGTIFALAQESGGVSSDSYSYTLGGSGASAFSLTNYGSYVGVTVGASGLSSGASTSGKLYALTVTAHDTTNGTASPAQGLDVVVGSGSSDVVNVASIVGSGGITTPTFVFGLAGADTINASGMYGAVVFDGGAGADTLTGGSGSNYYLYTATGDSTVSAMDVITNFHSSYDVLDFTGLNMHLNYAGKLASTATTVAADSVAYQQSGGNTFVYVNTGSSTEALGSANMKIELAGTITLSSGNISHS